MHNRKQSEFAMEIVELGEESEEGDGDDEGNEFEVNVIPGIPPKATDLVIKDKEKEKEASASVGLGKEKDMETEEKEKEVEAPPTGS